MMSEDTFPSRPVCFVRFVISFVFLVGDVIVPASRLKSLRKKLFCNHCKQYHCEKHLILVEILFLIAHKRSKSEEVVDVAFVWFVDYEASDKEEENKSSDSEISSVSGRQHEQLSRNSY